MKIIGLTGGIGAGKSTVSEYLKTQGIPIIDADKIAADIVAPGTKTLEELVEIFGEQIVDQRGRLKRKTLGQIAFSTEEGHKKLEAVTHPVIISEIKDQCGALGGQGYKLAVIDAALLYEAGLEKLCDSVWVVDANEDVRITRVMRRDGLSRAEIVDRIDRQAEQKNKLLKADQIIDNSKDKEKLYHTVAKLLEIYEHEKV